MVKSRREFVWRGMGLLVSTPFLLAVSKCNTSTSSLEHKSEGVSIPNQPSNLYTFDFASYPMLAQAGGSTQLVVNATSGVKLVSIVRFNAATAYAAYMYCSVSGCQLAPYNSTAAGGYSCGCDPAVFDASGAVVYGGATSPLTMYPSVVTASSIQVTIP